SAGLPWGTEKGPRSGAVYRVHSGRRPDAASIGAVAEALAEGEHHAVTAADELARALWRARSSGGVIARAAAAGITSTAAAYDVQRRVAALAGRKRVGWKVGATSAVVQTHFGVSEPATAPMFAADCHDSPAVIPVFDGQSVSVECELA